jgi:LytR cell envelope-related transcriptional attenuator
VEHSTPLPSADPWRAAAIVAAAIATVELLILVLIGVAFSTKFFAGEVNRAAQTALPTAPAAEQPATEPGSAADSTKSGASTQAKPMLPRRETAVIVLNGNGIAGAASTTADAVRARGYLISGSANAPRSDFASSVIMFRPGYRQEAERLGTDVKIRRVVPLDGISKGDLQGAHVALIIGG